MHILQPQYLLDTVFFKYTSPDGEVVYWRDCALQKGMIEGTQGYLWVFADGETFHSYRTPEHVFGVQP